MGYDDWDFAIRTGKFQRECRPLLSEQGLDPNTKPTHRWLRENGFSGIQNYADRNDMTIDEVLLNKLSFDPVEYTFGVNHKQTRIQLNRFITEEREDYHKWNNVTVDTVKSRLKTVTQASRKAHRG